MDLQYALKDTLAKAKGIYAAMSGDIKIVHDGVYEVEDAPADEVHVTVKLKCVDSKGNVHKWFNFSRSNAATIKGAGGIKAAATIEFPAASNAIDFVNGETFVLVKLAAGDYTGQAIALEFADLDISSLSISSISGVETLTIDNAMITQPGGEVLEAISARSVVFDFADNHGGAAYMDVRSIEFYLGSNLIEITQATPDISYYATSESASDMAELAFDVSLAKDGNNVDAAWVSSILATTEQRLIISFDNAPIDFTGIVINNGHNSGTNTDGGVKNAKITITDAVYSTTTYDAAVTGNDEVIWQGMLPEHTATDAAEDVSLPISGEITANYVIFDFADNYGSAMLMGQDDTVFMYEGEIIDVLSLPNTTTDATSALTSSDNGFVFDTPGSGWASEMNATTNQRLAIAFGAETPLTFDAINFKNLWSAGAPSDMSVKATRILAVLTDEAYAGMTTYDDDPPGLVSILFEGDMPNATAVPASDPGYDVPFF